MMVLVWRILSSVVLVLALALATIPPFAPEGVAAAGFMSMIDDKSAPNGCPDCDRGSMAVCPTAICAAVAGLVPAPGPLIDAMPVAFVVPPDEHGSGLIHSPELGPPRSIVLR